MFVSVNVAVQQSVVPDCVEDAIYQLSNVAHTDRLRRGSFARSQGDTRQNFREKDEILDSVQEHSAKNMAACGLQMRPCRCR